MTTNKVAIITGAAKGIGRSMAVKFAAKGYHLVLVDKAKRELAELKHLLEEENDIETLICAGDLAEEGFLKDIIAQTVRAWNRIDVLINNAAWRSIETMRDISIERWNTTINTCLTAPAFLAKYAAAVMEESHIPGVIINISSVMSQRAGGYSPAYTACKGALESLTYELAALYGPKNIRVLTINPGNIETDMSRDYTDSHGNNISNQLSDNINDHTPLQRPGRTAEIADVAYWLSTSEASFITGTTIVVDGGFSSNFNGYTMKKLQFPASF